MAFDAAQKHFDPISDRFPDDLQNQRWRLFDLLGAVDIEVRRVINRISKRNNVSG
jgi:hypothetical protein